MMSPKANKKKISRDMMLQEKKEWGVIRCASRSASKIEHPFDPLRDEVYGSEQYGSTALAFANVTLGSTHRNITFNWFKSQSVGFDVNVFNFSALFPITEQTWLITENYVTSRSGLVIGSLGVRRHSGWGFQYDFALDVEWGNCFYCNLGVFLNATIPIKY